MSNPIFTGVATALITPMNKDGSINFDKLAELVDFQIENGVAAIAASATTGEGSTLEHQEHLDVIKKVIEVANHRVPVIAGTGSNDTAYAVELSNESEQLGADALLMVTPYYNKTSQKGLIEHYKYISERVSTPIILYNVPSRTGTNILPETYKELAKIKNVSAIKEAGGNISEVAKTVSLCKDELTLYSGNDDQVLPIVSLGGKGVISVFSNMAPKIMSDLCNKALAGDFSGALEIQNKVLDVMNNMFIDVNPIPIKEAMNLAGFNVGGCRLPLCSTTPEKLEKIKASMICAGLL